jgi:hypothetical protein
MSLAGGSKCASLPFTCNRHLAHSAWRLDPMTNDDQKYFETILLLATVLIE